MTFSLNEAINPQNYQQEEKTHDFPLQITKFKTPRKVSVEEKKKYEENGIITYF